MKRSNHTTKKARGITVIECARKNTSNLYPFMNKILIGASEKSERINRNITEDMLSPIPNEWLTSKHEDMPENETPKVRIPWKSGYLSKRDLLIGVRPAERERILRKTISNLYPAVEQTI